MGNRLRAIFALLCWSTGLTRAWGHELKPHDTHELLRAWSFEPGIVGPLLVSVGLYIFGVSRLARGSRFRRGVRRWEIWCFTAGWVFLVIALVSPLHAWGGVLFSAHMVQHEILMLVAAPLLVLSRPMLPFLKAFPSGLARALAQVAHNSFWQRVWHTITLPFTAWFIHALALWFWHAPSLFQATLRHDLIHSLQHLSFLGSAVLFWWAVLHAHRRRAAYGAAVLYLFTTALHSGLLGALLTFAQRLLYPAYAPDTIVWGLTPLQDQQLGGLIMWIPAGLAYVVAGLALFIGWLREAEERAALQQRLPIEV